MSERPRVEAATIDRVDRLVHAAVDGGQVPGVVAAVARGDDVHVAVAGAMEFGGRPMTRDTLFRIASVTKPLTAAAVLAQIDAGLVALDEPVDRLLPELAGRRVLRTPDADLDDTVPADRPATVRDLLTFTWGFGMQGAMFQGPRPWPIVTAANERDLATFGPPTPGRTPGTDTWLARLAELPLLAQPGERWLYNTGIQVAGALAERADRAPLGEVMRERLFVPLGMRDTTFHTTDTRRLATVYEKHDGKLVVSDPPDGAWSRPPAFHDGAAGLLSTVDDLVAFGRALLRGGGSVLAPGTAAAMTRDQLTTAQREFWRPGYSILGRRGWGYGVGVAEDGGYGWEGGSGTAWTNVPAEDLTVVVLTQRAWDENGPPPILGDVLAAARAAS